MPGKAKGNNRIQFFLTDEELEAIRSAPWYKPFVRGISSGDSGSIKEFVLASVGFEYEDRHEAQSRAFRS